MSGSGWPALPYEGWKETYATLHMWLQVVGKVALAQAPPINHAWAVAFTVTGRGLSTYLLPHGAHSFTIEFDFVDHQLVIRMSDGTAEALPLAGRSVADFHREVMRLLQRMGLGVRIWSMPVEIPNPIRFEDDDLHHAYDADAATRFWQILARVAPIFNERRAGFLGKCSPVHFFWGAFDLACTRFSGRRAPPHPGGVPHLPDRIVRECYSHECISVGWWPGNAGGPIMEPAFYSYSYPEPAGYPEATVLPRGACYQRDLREFVLPYETVRTADRPDEVLLQFLQSSYEAGANLAGWDRPALERSRER
jgi:hypothetical protein